MDEAEAVRRITVLVHAGLLASVAIYAVVTLLFRSELVAPGTAPPPASTAAVLAVLGIAQFAAASAVGRRLLPSRRSRSGALDRVRLYFLLRAAAAEAIAVYGLILGIRGAAPILVLALFAEGLAALLGCAPTRTAWEAARRRAQGPVPPIV